MSEEEFARQLTDMVAKADIEGAKAKARLIVASGRSASLALDAILEGYNIVADLYRMGEYDRERFVKSEEAVKAAIETVEKYLETTRIRTDAKVAVGSVQFSGDLTSRIAGMMLKVAGFHVWEMHGRSSAKELLVNAEQSGVDLLLACISDSEEAAVLDFTKEVRAGNFAKRFPIVLLTAKGAVAAQDDAIAAVARNPTEAVSRVAEVLIKKRKLTLTE